MAKVIHGHPDPYFRESVLINIKDMEELELSGRLEEISKDMSNLIKFTLKNKDARNK